jgi:hypothetical protein
LEIILNWRRAFMKKQTTTSRFIVIGITSLVALAYWQRCC